MNKSNRLLSLPLLVSLTLLPALWLIVPATSHALSCAVLPGIEVAYGKSDAVILGQVDKVESVSDRSENNRVSITVIQSFKTIDEPNLTVLENKTWGALNGPSAVGEQYLMYLQSTADGWVHPLCTPSLAASQADAELDWLQDKIVPLKEQAMGGKPLVPQEKVSSALHGSDPADPGGSASADGGVSQIVLASLVSAAAVIAGVAVWVYAAWSRNNRNTRGM